MASSMTDFVGNITSNNIADDAAHFFDEIAILYNLIGKREDIEVCSDGNARFTLMMDSEEEASRLYSLLNGMDYTVYGFKYGIHMNKSNSNVFVNLIRIY